MPNSFGAIIIIWVKVVYFIWRKQEFIVEIIKYSANINIFKYRMRAYPKLHWNLGGDRCKDRTIKCLDDNQ